MTQSSSSTPSIAATCFIPNCIQLISKTQDNQRSLSSSGPTRNCYHLWLLTTYVRRKFRLRRQYRDKLSSTTQHRSIREKGIISLLGARKGENNQRSLMRRDSEFAQYPPHHKNLSPDMTKRRVYA